MLALLKLGGSLITDKNRAHTARRETLARLAQEIQAARRESPDMHLIVGHGSGSFGHVAARKHGTRGGVITPEGWLGFAEVWKEARALNQVVVEALVDAGLPVMAFPPSAAVVASDGQVKSWDLAPLRSALEAGLLPLINGDTIFDIQRGGTILSTEELFGYLAPHLGASRIFLAGLESGVWADYPTRRTLITEITPESYRTFAGGLGGSSSVDVTGGMSEKVSGMLRLVEQVPGLEALIFSGEQPGTLAQALLGSTPGTRIYQPSPAR